MKKNFYKYRLSILGLDEYVAKANRFLEKIRFNDGSYPARTSDDLTKSVTTTALICIARKKTGETKFPLDLRTKKDLDFIVRNFDKNNNAWRIFGNEIPSPWTTAFCVWALSLYNRGDLACVKKAVETLLNWQKEGGWSVIAGTDNEILVSYMVTAALVIYYSKYKYNKEEINQKLRVTYDYFNKMLDKQKINSLNITDCALAFQGIYNIYSSINVDSLLDKRKMNSLRKKTLERLHDLISSGKYTESTKIKISIKSGEWLIYHFHPGVLHIVAQHDGDPFDVFKLLKWFMDKENFKEFGKTMGYWQHFANKEENVYTTALALIALYEFVKRCDFISALKEKVADIEQENEKLRRENIILKMNIKSLIWTYFKKYSWKVLLLILAILGAISGIQYIIAHLI